MLCITLTLASWKTRLTALLKPFAVPPLSQRFVYNDENPSLETSGILEMKNSGTNPLALQLPVLNPMRLIRVRA